MKSAIRIITPDGRTHQRSAPQQSQTVAEWLEVEHLPLNTRCGGRGLCRGCLLDIDGEEVRACQCRTETLEEIRIPESSLRDRRINGVSTFQIEAHGYRLRHRGGIGLALDIGTTTVAAVLWNLQTGECMAQGSVANEQRRFGDNVLSRIEHAISQGGKSTPLQKALVIDSLLPLIQSLCQESGLRADEITEGVAAGNTVMIHSLVGEDLNGFAAYPFTPVFVDTRTVDAQALGFDHAFPLTLTPHLGAFVGGDICAGALTSGMLEHSGCTLLIDFGTNGELLLKTRNETLATATAVGPAFEGGRLRCGAPAGKGVISSMEWQNEEWQVRFTGDEPATQAKGISGAAYIDFMACARRIGLLNEMGRFEAGHPDVETIQTQEGPVKRVKVYQKQYVSETDIAELIQAKAAIAAGIMTLLEEAGLTAQDLDTVYIAGGFGYHLNCINAMAIGMIPHLEQERIRIIGNASLGGASLMLQASCEEPLQKLQVECKIIELNQISGFEDQFIDCMPLAVVE